MTRKRLLWIGFLIFALFASTIPLLYLSLRPSVIHAKVDDTEITFVSDRRLVLPGFCTTIHWQVSANAEVYLDEKPVAVADQTQVCPLISTWRTLSVVTQTGEKQKF
ncbi:MAG: hypothetical protein ABI612_26800, partial [Betaproteobacteria bacterium]